MSLVHHSLVIYTKPIQGSNPLGHGEYEILVLTNCGEWTSVTNLGCLTLKLALHNSIWSCMNSLIIYAI
jgi:hypothetical protein